MTRAQQIQVVTHLRELQEALADVEFGTDARGNWLDERRSPPYVIGRSRSIVKGALEAAGEKLESGS